LAKISGLGALVSVADAGGTPRVISNDVSDFTLNTPRAVQDITGVDKSAHERLLLLADVSVSLKGTFNSAANLSHAVLNTVPSTAVQRAVSIAPTSNNSTPILNFNAMFSSYDVSRAADGKLDWGAKGDLSDGALPTWS
jgi:hypothetical protein